MSSWLIIVVLLASHPDLAGCLGTLPYFVLMNGAFPVIVETRSTVQRALPVPIEGRGADAALRDGFRTAGWIFAHTLLTLAYGTDQSGLRIGRF